MYPRFILAALLLACALGVQAEVYKWADQNGKVTYTDTPPPAAAVKVETVEQRISVMGMDPAVRAAGERRLAQQAIGQEREWQQRQQAMLAQQSYQPSPAVNDFYSEPYYDDFYYSRSYAYYPRYYHLAGYRPGARYPRVMHYSRVALPPRAGSTPPWRDPAPTARTPALSRAVIR